LKFERLAAHSAVIVKHSDRQTAARKLIKRLFILTTTISLILFESGVRKPFAHYKGISCELQQVKQTRRMNKKTQKTQKNH